MIVYNLVPSDIVQVSTSEAVWNFYVNRVGIKIKMGNVEMGEFEITDMGLTILESKLRLPRSTLEMLTE